MESGLSRLDHPHTELGQDPVILSDILIEVFF